MFERVKNAFYSIQLRAN